MSDIGISADDRERLAKQKFSEFLDELFDERYIKAREKRLATTRHPQQQQPQPQQQSTGENGPQQQQQRPQRRRSLLEECFSQTFGWS